MIDDEFVFIHGDGDDVEMMVGEDAGCDEVGGLFDEDGVASLGEERTQQIQCGGDARRDEDIFWICRMPIPATQELGEGEF